MEQQELLTITTDRETIRAWLLDKHVALWSDWCIHHEDSMQHAIDWFVAQMSSLATYEPEEPKGQQFPAHLLERAKANDAARFNEGVREQARRAMQNAA